MLCVFALIKNLFVTAFLNEGNKQQQQKKKREQTEISDARAEETARNVFSEIIESAPRVVCEIIS